MSTWTLEKRSVRKFKSPQEWFLWIFTDICGCNFDLKNLNEECVIMKCMQPLKTEKME